MSLKKGTKDVSLLTKIPPNVEPKTITTNGTYVASDEGLDGYSQVEVATSGVDINEYFIRVGNSSMTNLKTFIKNIPIIDVSGYTTMYEFFYGYYNLEAIPQMDTSKVTDMTRMFGQCRKIETIPQIDTSNVTNMQGMFNYCYNLKTIPQMDTSKVTDMSSMFFKCNNLISIPSMDTSKVTNMGSMFTECYSIETIPQINTSNVTNMASMFFSASKLNTLPLLDTSKVVYIGNMFANVSSLINIGGFENLGQAYLTTQSANNSDYQLTISNNKNITHDSLMNIINNLYDIKAKGVKPQKIQIGTSNLAKLSEEERNIAVSKGWTLS